MITYNQSDTQIKLNAWVNNVKATEVPIDITNKI